MADYYIIGGDGKEYGPYPAEKIHQLISENRLLAESRIRAENEPWTTVAEIGVFDSTIIQPTPSLGQPPLTREADYPVQPYGQYTQPNRTGPPNNQLAITGLVLGISSFVLSCCCSQVPILGLIGILVSFITPIAGLICSIIARSQIKKSNGTQGGEGFALAGIIISSVYLLLILAIIGLVVAGVVAASQFGRP